MNCNKINGRALDALEKAGLGESVNLVGAALAERLEGKEGELTTGRGVIDALASLMRLRSELRHGRHS